MAIRFQDGVSRVVDWVSGGRNSRKLKSTLESLQSEVDLLRYENQGLRETIIQEKKRRQRDKALKDLLFDRTDPNAAQVFSPAKVAQARVKKAEIDAQRKEEALKKEAQKVQRQKKAAEQKALALERRRQREAETERKRQAKEARQQEREENRQIRRDLERQNLEIAHKMEHEGQPALDGREKSADVEDEIIVALPPTREPPAAWKTPDPPRQNAKLKAIATPNRTASPKKPFLVVENDREMVVAFRDSRRPQRNSKRPRWLEDYEIE
ncbi:DDE superfamily endonuclease, CENP-B-like protein [Pochonia chlamydosporia 170]|uniref:DDE superfamily endonuclease, CENP-B-like protein n=1 Tax=Pochonia chlamydosporia 170 TaxID=1380566 RepID=A0A219APD5_METCM|nr:DDE superfamily endonuclease, CENP-B-like protein [Pochonia chlamydosporia 170]OWT42561.1 DDE superfamily endonuclease, CENP-B-like protein [Pochonia chlamydosporia 170]